MSKSISPWLALIIVLTAPLLSVIDVFIVNVAIPSIQGNIHATDAQVQLVIAAYLLGYAAFLITGGRSGDHYGRKQTFFWGMFAFTAFSCLCGLSQTPDQLNLMRFLQGIAAAFMLPQSIAFIQVLFTDPKERSKAIGWFGITLGLASVIGQVLGGYFAGGHFFVSGWRLIFFINLPIGLLSLLAAQRYLPETERHRDTRMDLSGVVILTIALFSLIYPLIQGREAGWPWWSFAMLLFAVVTTWYFFRNQAIKKAQGKTPLIDTALFTFHDFNLGLIAVLCHFIVHTSYLLLSAVFIQNGLGVDPLTAGLYFIAPGILFTVSSVVAARLLPRYGTRVLQAGIVMMVVAFALQVVCFRPGASAALLFTLLGLYGLGNGLILPSLLNITLRSLPPKFAGAAAGIYSTVQQTSSALGICLIGGLFYYIIDYSGDIQLAFHYGLVAHIALLAVLSILLMRLPNNVQLKRRLVNEIL